MQDERGRLHRRQQIDNVDFIGQFQEPRYCLT